MKKTTHQHIEPLTGILLFKRTTYYLLGFIPIFSSIIIQDKNKQS